MSKDTRRKRQWQKPELQILVRLKQDEAVLQGCKTIIAAGPGQLCQIGQPPFAALCDVITLS